MRGLETGLARFTLAALVIYFPLETWASLPYGLWHPMYLVDFIAICLLAFGGWHSLRARPRSAPGPLAAAWGWASANGWRATAWRWEDRLENGGANLDHGTVELWSVTVASSIAMICFGMSLVLAARGRRPSWPAENNGADR